MVRIVNEVSRDDPRLKPRRRNKYNVAPKGARTVDGVVFASKAEAECYGQLKMLRQKGLVRWFALQPKFVLAGGVTYRADFVVVWTAQTRSLGFDLEESILEVKGHETEAWRIKRKLLEAEGLDVAVIPSRDAGNVWRWPMMLRTT